MRKTDLKGIRISFDSDIAEFTHLFDMLVGAVSAVKSHGLIAEQTMLTAVTRWEGFLSSLFIAYVNRSSSQARTTIETDLKNSANTKFGKGVSSKLRIALPTHLLQADAAEALDAQGRNITFSDADKLVDGAKRWLSPGHRKNFTALGLCDRAAITAWVKIRNCIAHRSRKAYREMNDVLADKNLAKGLSRGKNEVWTVGAFLRSVPPVGGDRRVIQYLDTMRRIATAL